MADRRVGTVSRGIRCPIIREGDDLVQIVTDSVIEAAQIEGFELHDRDVISIYVLVPVCGKEVGCAFVLQGKVSL